VPSRSPVFWRRLAAHIVIVRATVTEPRRPLSVCTFWQRKCPGERVLWALVTKRGQRHAARYNLLDAVIARDAVADVLGHIVQTAGWLALRREPPSGNCPRVPTRSNRNSEDINPANDQFEPELASCEFDDAAMAGAAAEHWEDEADFEADDQLLQWEASELSLIKFVIDYAWIKPHTPSAVDGRFAHNATASSFIRTDSMLRKVIFTATVDCLSGETTDGRSSLAG
jgi:hypothetical protein